MTGYQNREVEVTFRSSAGVDATAERVNRKQVWYLLAKHVDNGPGINIGYLVHASPCTVIWVDATSFWPQVVGYGSNLTPVPQSRFSALANADAIAPAGCLP